MVYLIEKDRIPPTALDDLRAAIADPRAVLRYVPLDEEIAIKMAEVPRQHIPDLPDRVIAATSYRLMWSSMVLELRPEARNQLKEFGCGGKI